MQSIFNTLLRNDPNFVNVKDKDNILKSILIIKPPNYEIKMKFGKYLLMEDKTLANYISHNARREAIKHFDMEHISLAWKDYLDNGKK